jgi:hypothetical protein
MWRWNGKSQRATINTIHSELEDGMVWCVTFEPSTVIHRSNGNLAQPGTFTHLRELLAQLGRGREKTRRLSNMTAAAEWVTAYWEIGINGIQCCAQEEKLWYTLMRDRWWGIPLCNHDRGLIIHKMKR